MTGYSAAEDRNQWRESHHQRYLQRQDRRQL